MKWVEIEVEEIVKETDAAFLVRMEDQEDDIWLPKSQVCDPQDYEEGYEGVLYITPYIAREKNLES